MLTSAVICEFNPFHNGHKYLLEHMRAQGSECIVAVMSGSFTQRGDVAVYPKFKRAEDAIRNGADLVIELPAVWAVASAQRFAKGGCDIIKALGCIDRVYFGSECGDMELLHKALTATEDERVNHSVKKLMAEGEYFPLAMEKAVSEHYSREIADIIRNPNNTLGIEYMRCLKGSGIEVCTVGRTGVSHDSNTTEGKFASASKIRDMIQRDEDFEEFVPYPDINRDNPAFMELGERAILYKLRDMTAEDIKNLPDVTEGLENRILDAVHSKSSVNDILEEIKTKRYTHARLRRILTCGMLGITKAHQATDVPYVRILGFNSYGEQLIKTAKDTCSLPMIINVAQNIKSLSERAQEIFGIDMKATDIRTVFEKAPTDCRQDYTNGIIKL
ncbi:MAG: nucleotidyltransferase family protein [Clostridia bacterium]|nr:nucleotidyltransferase family protein [Clostridia bacterium]